VSIAEGDQPRKAGAFGSFPGSGALADVAEGLETLQDVRLNLLTGNRRGPGR
jgi:hypothetical protein